MHIEEAALDQVVGHLARLDLKRLDLRGALEEVSAAMPPLFGVDGAGVLLIDENQVLRYCAATDDASKVLEAAQESTGEGPCVESLVMNSVVSVPDLEADGRWPHLVPLVVPNGIRAVLGVPVSVAGGPVGSLNVYRSETYEWDDSDVRATQAFAGIVSQLIGLAMVADGQGDVVAQLQRALEARVMIERAVGVLIAVEGLDAPSAFERLRRAARSSRTRAADVAARVVAERRLRDD
ncbi:MAG: GAF and ANTAR domain-containing protein [Actinobacteria bacterium]|nr:GAF and ANTAR domain-containing protein [Actinomycetota bacterium]